MLKKLLCLMLAAATVMTVTVTAFAGKGSRRIEIDSYDSGEINSPNTSTTFYLEDSSGDSLTRNYDGIKDYSLTATIDSKVTQVNKSGHVTPANYTADIVLNGKNYNLIVDCRNFPTNQSENYVEEITVKISGDKIFDDGTRVPMSSKSLKMSFGDGRVGASDLKYMPYIDENGIDEVKSSRGSDDISLDPEFIPGINYYFDILTMGGGSNFTEYDLKDYTITASTCYNSSIFKTCEIVKDKYGNLQLHIQGDPSQKYGEGKFGKFKVVAYPKGQSRRRMESYYAIGFSFPERDINTDDFFLDQEQPLLLMPEWDDTVTFTARIDNVGNVKFRNFSGNRIVNMSYDTEEVKCIKDANPSASVGYLTFHAKPEFEVPAIVSYRSDKPAYVYEIADNGIVTPVSAEHKNGYMVWKTSVLGSYAVSNKALNNGKINPSTTPTAPTETVNSTPEITKITIGGAKNERNISTTNTAVTHDDLAKAFADNGSNNIYIDTYEGNKVRGRFYIDKALAQKIKNPINTKVITNPSYKDNAYAINLFTKYFDNKIMAVTFDHKGTFGAQIPVAVKVNFDGFKGDKVYIYRYNAENNTYKFLQTSKAIKDDLSYFYFNTEYGDTLVMTDGPLKDKA